MKLTGGVKIDMAIQAGHAQTRLGRFPIRCQVEFFLRELGHQHSQTIQLNGRDESAKKAIKIIRAQHLSLRDVAQFWMGGQENGRGKFRKKTIREVEVYIETLKPWKLLHLLLRKHLAADLMFDVR